MSIQRYVVCNSGVNVESCKLMYINTDYFQTTDETNWEQFFIQNCLDNALASTSDVKQHISDIKKYWRVPSHRLFWIKTYAVDVNAVHIAGGTFRKILFCECLRAHKGISFWKKGILVYRMCLLKKIKNERVRRWLDVYRTQLPYINKEAVANWLKKLVYPLYLLRLFSQNVR